MRCRWSYDAENDDLLVYSPDAKSKGAVEWGNFVFDVDKRNSLVGIQVLNASKSLAELMPCVDDVKNLVSRRRKTRRPTSFDSRFFD